MRRLEKIGLIPLLMMLFLCTTCDVSANTNTDIGITKYTKNITINNETKKIDLYNNSFVTLVRIEEVESIFGEITLEQSEIDKRVLKEYLYLEEIEDMYDLVIKKDIYYNLTVKQKDKEYANKYEPVINDRDYEWFYSQIGTGNHSYDNCGPAVVNMAVKWYNKEYEKSVEDVRNTSRKHGGWWYDNDIVKYLNDNYVNYKKLIYKGEHTLKQVIDDGNIAIVVLNYSLLNKDNRGTGHFMIVYGYEYKLNSENEAETEIYFIMKDPLKSSDKEVYHSGYNVNIAINRWWDYIFEIKNNKK